MVNLLHTYVGNMCISGFPGANPMIVRYYAMSSLVRFGNKIFSLKNALVYYNAGVVKSEAVGLAPIYYLVLNAK
jgi:hypothetical protein